MGFCQQQEGNSQRENISVVSKLELNKEEGLIRLSDTAPNKVANMTPKEFIENKINSCDSNMIGSDVESFNVNKNSDINRVVENSIVEREEDVPTKEIKGLKFCDTEKGQKENTDADKKEEHKGNFKESKHSLHDFDLLQDLGKGAFGDVFLVRKNKGSDLGQHFALKMIYKKKIKEDEHYSIHFKSERTALGVVRDGTFLSTLFYAFQTETNLYLVMDYNSGGQLLNQFVGKNLLFEREMRFYLCELLVALEYLHEHDIIHRDIKPENILLDKSGHIVLIDYGLSKLSGSHMNESYVGTEPYIAPEIILHKPHDRMVDFWSIGVLGFEMVNGTPPFSLRNTDENLRKAVLHQTPQFSPKKFAKTTQLLLTGLLQKNPKIRFGCFDKKGAGGMPGVMAHKFFKGVKWPDVRARKMRPPSVPEYSDPVKLKARPFTEPPDSSCFRRHFGDYEYCYSNLKEPLKS